MNSICYDALCKPQPNEAFLKVNNNVNRLWYRWLFHMTWNTVN